MGPTPPPVHGTAAYVRMLLDAPTLRERWDVLHLDTSDRRSLENLGRIDPTNVALALAHVASVARTVWSEGVDVVWVPVSQNAPGYLRDALFILAARAGGARVVTHLHGGWFRDFYERASAPVRWVVRASSARVDRAWVLGAGLRSVYAGLIPDAHLRVVPNGVPAVGEGATAAAREPEAEGPPVILHLGQLSVSKGILDLLAAARGLLDRGRDFRLVLAGAFLSADDEARIRTALRADPELASTVELAGVVTGRAKADLFVRAAVFVLATRYPYEGQPLAILEAMSAGVPVVATPRGAIADTVQEGVTGFLVPEGDVDALRGALARLLDEPDERARMGALARRRWEEEFTAERALARVIEALEELRA